MVLGIFVIIKIITCLNGIVVPILYPLQNFSEEGIIPTPDDSLNIKYPTPAP